MTAKFNLKELYEKVGFSKESISKGRLAELDADERGFTDEEQAYFESSARYAYESFRNKAARGRKMTQESMEAIAQGRVWCGKRAANEELVDYVGGLSKAIQVALTEAGKEKAKYALTFEVSSPTPPFQRLLSSGVQLLLNFDVILNLVEDIGKLQGKSLQYLMDDIEL